MRDANVKGGEVRWKKSEKEESLTWQVESIVTELGDHVPHILWPLA